MYLKEKNVSYIYIFFFKNYYIYIEREISIALSANYLWVTCSKRKKKVLPYVEFETVTLACIVHLVLSRYRHSDFDAIPA